MTNQLSNIKKQFKTYKPEVYKVPITEYAKVVEDAMIYSKYGIYISYGDVIHAYHGNGEIDYNLCEELGIEVVELGYNGGTIIGSEKDLSIIIIFPKDLGLTHEIIINKIVKILSKYLDNVTVDGNDILINGDKVSGSMMRHLFKSSVWAAQISFNDYSEFIEKICNKPAVKKPSYIDNNLLNRDVLESEIVTWLQGNKL